jgi:HSP20 family protein
MAKKKTVRKAVAKKSTAGARVPVARPTERPVASLREEIDRAFDRFFRDPWLRDSFGPGWGLHQLADWDPFKSLGGAGMTRMLSPSAEMKELDHGYELSIELPGIDEKDIELTVTDDMVTLKGEKREERTGDEQDSHFSERRYGAFRRTFSMPPGVKTEDIKASFVKGVLTLTMPKSEETKAKVRRIPVGGR